MDAPEAFMPEQMIGERVARRFIIERLIGTGPLSSAFRARDELLERRVTVKLFHPQHPDDVAVIHSQLELATSVARLSHPNIVTVIDRGEHDGSAFIVLEHVRGENLQERIDRYAPLDVGEVAAHGLAIARALAYAHAQGVVHGNVRPVNVLVSEDRDVKIVDFGGGSYVASLAGTDPYVAPEQRVFDDPHRSAAPGDDIYALGVLMYFALTDELPIAGGDQAHLQLMRPDAPQRLIQALSRATAPDPGMRTTTMQELASELAALRSRTSTPTRQVVEPAAHQEAEGSEANEHEATSVMASVALESFSGQPDPRPAVRRSSARERWSRLAGWSMFVVPLIGVLLVAIVIAGERQKDGRGAGSDSGSLVARQSVDLTRVSSFDPLTNDSDKQEHQDLVQFLIDGKTGTSVETSWQTEGYEIELPKAGVGVWVAAAKPVRATELRIRTDLEGWGFEVYATNDPEDATRLDDWTRVTDREYAADDKKPVVLDTKGRAYEAYLIWITRLSVDTEDTNKLRARISEVILRTP